MTLESVRRWFTSQPWWLHLLIFAAVIAVLVEAVRAALPTWSVLPAFGSLAISLPTLLWKKRRFRRLWQEDRIAVEDAMRTDVSTGSPTLDQIARARLGRRARSFASDRMLAPLVFLAAVGLPVVSAARTGDGWWLAASIALCAQLIVSESAIPKIRGLRSHRSLATTPESAR